MSKLEERFLSKLGETVIDTSDPRTTDICKVLGKALGKSDWIARGGISSKYYFNFDKIYNNTREIGLWETKD